MQQFYTIPRSIHKHVHTSVARADALATSLYEAASHHLPSKHLRTDYTDSDPDIESDFYIRRHTACPAVLTENLFMDNHKDCDFLLSEEGREAIVDLHVDGFLLYVALNILLLLLLNSSAPLVSWIEDYCVKMKIFHYLRKRN